MVICSYNRILCSRKNEPKLYRGARMNLTNVMCLKISSRIDSFDTTDKV